MLYKLLSSLAFLILKFIFRLKVFGKKHIPKEGGFILASNHASYLDPVVIGAVCPRRLNFMARHDLFYNPLFAWLISNVGAFPIKRNSPNPSALKEAIRRLKMGNVLLVFPEGTRQIGQVTPAPHAGVGFLADKASVPIVPAFIKGTKEAFPKGAKFIKPKEISVYFGRQIPIERRVPYQEIAQRVMEDIRHLSCYVSS